MMKKVFSILLSCFTFLCVAQKKVEFYYANGKLKQEGHYQNGYKVKWWIDYDENGFPISKIEYRNDTVLQSAFYYNGKIRAEYDFTRHPVYGFGKTYNGKGVAWKETYGRKSGSHVEDHNFTIQNGYHLARTDEGYLHYYIYKVSISDDGGQAVHMPRYYWNREGKVMHVSYGDFKFAWHNNGQLSEISADYTDTGNKIWYRWNEKGERVDNGLRVIENDTLRFNTALGNIKLTQQLDKDLPHGKWECNYHNGKKWFVQEFDHGVPVGIFKAWYFNGQRQVEFKLLDAFPHGLYTEYYANGKLKFQGNFSRGIKTGNWKYWDKNGVLMYDENYSFGRLHGEVKKYYYQTGKLLSESNYVLGAKEGWQYEYYENGQLKSENFCSENYLAGWSRTYYQNGKLQSEKYSDVGPAIEYFENGSVQNVHSQSHDNGGFHVWYLSSGKLNAMSYRWSDTEMATVNNTNGTLVSSYVKGDEKNLTVPLDFISNPPETLYTSRGETVNGKKEGKWTAFYPNGKKWIEMPFTKGLLNGTGRIWSVDGKLLEEIEFRNDMRHGSFVYYDHRGNKLQQGSYANNKKNGDYRMWDKKTLKLVYFQQYKNGIPHGISESYTSDGHPYYLNTYVNGKKNGLSKYYNTTQHYLAAETMYKDDKQWGSGKIYAPEGYLKYNGEYENGKRNGPWTEYDKNGDIVEVRNYYYGEMEVKLPENMSCVCVENYTNTSNTSFWPLLEHLVSYKQFSSDLTSVLYVSPNVYDGLFYRNYQFDASGRGDSRWGALEIMSFDTLWAELNPMPGLRFVLNPCLQGNQISHTPFNVHSHLPIKSYTYNDDDTLNETPWSYFKIAMLVSQLADADIIQGLISFIQDEEHVNEEQAWTKMVEWLKSVSLITKSYTYEEFELLLDEMSESEMYDSFYSIMFNKWFAGVGVLDEHEDANAYYVFTSRLEKFIRSFNMSFSVSEMKELYEKQFDVHIDVKTISVDFPKALFTQWDKVKNAPLLFKEKTLPGRLTFGVKNIEYRGQWKFNDASATCFTPSVLGKTKLIIDIKNAEIVTDNSPRYGLPEDFRPPVEIQSYFAPGPGIWTLAAEGMYAGNKSSSIQFDHLHITGNYAAGTFKVNSSDFEKQHMHDDLKKQCAYFYAEEIGNQTRCWFLIKK